MGSTKTDIDDIDNVDEWISSSSVDIFLWYDRTKIHTILAEIEIEIEIRVRHVNSIKNKTLNI